MGRIRECYKRATNIWQVGGVLRGPLREGGFFSTCLDKEVKEGTKGRGRGGCELTTTSIKRDVTSQF